MRRRRKSASASCDDLPLRPATFFSRFTSAEILSAIRAASLPTGSASSNGVSGRARTSQISMPAALSLHSRPQGRGFALLSKRTAVRPRMTSLASRASSRVAAVVAGPLPDATTAPVMPENMIPALRCSSSSGTRGGGCSGPSAPSARSSPPSASARAAHSEACRDARMMGSRFISPHRFGDAAVRVWPFGLTFFLYHPPVSVAHVVGDADSGADLLLAVSVSIAKPSVAVLSSSMPAIACRGSRRGALDRFCAILPSEKPWASSRGRLGIPHHL